MDMVSPAGGGAQLAMMEFPLYPVFLRAAVQTLPVPWGWAGLGKSACLPITHLATLEREQSAQTYGVLSLHKEISDQSLFVQHLFTFSLLLTFSGLSLSQKQTRWDLTNGSPIKYQWLCLHCFSVSWSLQCGCASVRMTIHRRPIFYVVLYVSIHFSICTFGFILVCLVQNRVVICFALSVNVWRPQTSDKEDLAQTAIADAKPLFIAMKIRHS